MVIPCSAAATEPTAAELQEVIKVELIPDHEFMPKQPVFNNRLVQDPATILQKDRTVEILLRNSTIRFFHGADRELIGAMLRCLGGNAYAG